MAMWFIYMCMVTTMFYSRYSVDATSGRPVFLNSLRSFTPRNDSSSTGCSSSTTLIQVHQNPVRHLTRLLILPNASSWPPGWVNAPQFNYNPNYIAPEPNHTNPIFQSINFDTRKPINTVCTLKLAGLMSYLATTVLTEHGMSSWPVASATTITPSQYPRNTDDNPSQYHYLLGVPTLGIPPGKRGSQTSNNSGALVSNHGSWRAFPGDPVKTRGYLRWIGARPEARAAPTSWATTPLHPVNQRWIIPVIYLIILYSLVKAVYLKNYWIIHIKTSLLEIYYYKTTHINLTISVQTIAMASRREIIWQELRQLEQDRYPISELHVQLPRSAETEERSLTIGNLRNCLGFVETTLGVRFTNGEDVLSAIVESQFNPFRLASPVGVGYTTANFYHVRLLTAIPLDGALYGSEGIIADTRTTSVIYTASIPHRQLMHQTRQRSDSIRSTSTTSTDLDDIFAAARGKSASTAPATTEVIQNSRTTDGGRGAELPRHKQLKAARRKQQQDAADGRAGGVQRETPPTTFLVRAGPPTLQRDSRIVPIGVVCWSDDILRRSLAHSTILIRQEIIQWCRDDELLQPLAATVSRGLWVHYETAVSSASKGNKALAGFMVDLVVLQDDEDTYGPAPESLRFLFKTNIFFSKKGIRGHWHTRETFEEPPAARGALPPLVATAFQYLHTARAGHPRRTIPKLLALLEKSGFAMEAIRTILHCPPDGCTIVLSEVSLARQLLTALNGQASHIMGVTGGQNSKWTCHPQLPTTTTSGHRALTLPAVAARDYWVDALDAMTMDEETDLESQLSELHWTGDLLNGMEAPDHSMLIKRTEQGMLQLFFSSKAVPRLDHAGLCGPIAVGQLLGPHNRRPSPTDLKELIPGLTCQGRTERLAALKAWPADRLPCPQFIEAATRAVTANDLTQIPEPPKDLTAEAILDIADANLALCTRDGWLQLVGTFKISKRLTPRSIAALPAGGAESYLTIAIRPGHVDVCDLRPSQKLLLTLLERCPVLAAYEFDLEWSDKQTQMSRLAVAGPPVPAAPAAAAAKTAQAQGAWTTPLSRTGVQNSVAMLRPLEYQNMMPVPHISFQLTLRSKDRNGLQAKGEVGSAQRRSQTEKLYRHGKWTAAILMEDTTSRNSPGQGACGHIIVEQAYDAQHDRLAPPSAYAIESGLTNRRQNLIQRLQEGLVRNEHRLAEYHTREGEGFSVTDHAQSLRGKLHRVTQSYQSREPLDLQYWFSDADIAACAQILGLQLVLLATAPTGVTSFQNLGSLTTEEVEAMTFTARHWIYYNDAERHYSYGGYAPLSDQASDTQEALQLRLRTEGMAQAADILGNCWIAAPGGRHPPVARAVSHKPREEIQPTVSYYAILSDDEEDPAHRRRQPAPPELELGITDYRAHGVQSPPLPREPRPDKPSIQAGSTWLTILSEGGLAGPKTPATIPSWVRPNPYTEGLPKAPRAVPASNHPASNHPPAPTALKGVGSSPPLPPVRKEESPPAIQPQPASTTATPGPVPVSPTARPANPHLSADFSTIRTLQAQHSGGGQEPPLDTQDPMIRQFIERFPDGQRLLQDNSGKRERGGVTMAKGQMAAAGTMLTMAIGCRTRGQPRRRRPRGKPPRLYVSLGMLDQEDAQGVLGPATLLLLALAKWNVHHVSGQVSRLDKQLHGNFVPHFQRTATPEEANAKWAWSPTGHPVVMASKQIDEGEEVVLHWPEAMTTAEPPAEPPPMEPPPTEPPPRLVQTAPEGIRHRARVERIRDPTTGQVSTLRTMTYNINGNWNSLALQDEVAALIYTEDLDGIFLIDARVPQESVKYLVQQWSNRLSPTETIIRVLPGKLPEQVAAEEGGTRDQLVGGSIFIMRPTKDLTLRALSYDPGRHGIISKAHIGIGPTLTIVWIAAYVPTYNSGSSGLDGKVRSWHRRVVDHHPPDSHGQSSASGAEWTWKLIEDQVARSQLNRCHLGVIVSGDFNQTWDLQDLRADSLRERTANLGLHESWAGQTREESSPTFTFYRGQTSSWIDHVFTDLGEGALELAYVPSGSRLSDHVPVVGVFNLPLHDHRRHRLPKQHKAIKLDVETLAKGTRVRKALADACERRLNKANLRKPHTGVEAGHQLELISRLLADAGEEVSNSHKPTGSGGNRTPGAAPLQSIRGRAIGLHLKFLFRIVDLRKTTRSRQGYLLSELDRRRKYRRMIHSWNLKEEALWLGQEDRPESCDWGTGHDRDWWARATDQEIEEELATDMGILKDQEVACLTAETKAKINEFILKREAACEAGHLTMVIRSVLRKTRNPLNLSVLDTPDGITSDPATIHETLKGWWENIWRIPTDSPAARLGLEPATNDSDTLEAADKWEQILEDPTRLGEIIGGENSPIPTHLLTALGEAISTSPGRLTLEEEIEREMTKEFSIDQMRRFIGQSSNSAGGLTGATYQLLKYAPDAIVKKTFSLMNKMWTDGQHIPLFWKLKGLHGIPKTSSPEIKSVGDMRGIGLIEVTRKLWTRMVLARIKTVLERHHAIQKQHCGGLRNRGTDSALLQTLNMIEAMQEDWDQCSRNHDEDREQHLDFLSWDTAKAFDSVGNHIQYIAWRRKGVPRDVAMWLIRLDLGGRFIPLSPYAGGKLSKVTMDMNNPTAHHDLLYQLGCAHQRGLTQGDVKSPLGWILTFDILITALNQCTPKEYPKAPMAGIHVFTQLPTVFLDDLTSFTASRHHTQRLADLVSAFNAVVGMKFAKKKFRALSTRTDDPTPIQVYDWMWEPTEIQLMDETKSAKVLGINLSLDYKFTRFVQEAISDLSGIGRILMKSRASPRTKAKVLITSVMAGLDYKASLSAWPMASLQSIQQAISRVLLTIFHLPSNYPYWLLYSKEGGRGLPYFLDRVLGLRWRILERCIYGDWPACAAARGLIERSFSCERDEQATPGTDPAALPDHRKLRKFFIGALIQGSQGRLTLRRRTNPQARTRMGDILAATTQPVRDLLQFLNVQFLSDLADEGSRPLEWIHGQSLKRQGREELVELIRRNPPPETRMLSEGHILILHGGDFKTETYLLVDGLIQDRNGSSQRIAGASFQRATLQPPGFLGFKLAPTTENSTEYAGCVRQGHCTVYDLHHHCVGIAFGVLLGRDNPEDKMGHWRILGENRSRVQWEIPTCPTAHKYIIPHWASQAAMEVPRDAVTPVSVIATDASSKRRNATCAEQWDRAVSLQQAQGAIVFDDWRSAQADSLYPPAAVMQIVNIPRYLDSCNKAELLTVAGGATMGAALRTTTKLETDSLSTLKKLKTEESHLGDRVLNSTPFAPLYRGIHRAQQACPTMRFRHVYAHAERRTTNRKDWSRGEVRNVIADGYADILPITQIATSLYRASGPAMNPDRQNVYQVEARTVLRGLFQPDDYYWEDTESGCPHVGQIFDCSEEFGTRYLQARTACSVSRFPWSDVKLGLLQTVMKNPKNWKGIASLTEIMAQLWDKLHHSRNSAKFGEATEYQCILCNRGVDDQSHALLLCHHPLMTTLRTELFNDLLQVVKAGSEDRVARFLRVKLTWAQDNNIRTGAPPDHRLRFLLGMPLASDLEDGPLETNLTNAETASFQGSLLLLWTTFMTYAITAWRLRRVLLAASQQLLQELRDNPPTLTAIRALANTRITQSARNHTHQLARSGFIVLPQQADRTRRVHNNAPAPTPGKRPRSSQRKTPEPRQRKRQRLDDPPGEPPGQTSTKDCLLIGMAFHKESTRDQSQQAKRDTLRCLAFEDTHGARVFTVDRDSDTTSTIPGRHSRCDINSGKLCTEILENQLNRGPSPDPITMICLDYFSDPAGWTTEGWGPTFFAETIPSWAQRNFLGIGSSIWLPATAHIEKTINSHRVEIEEHYELDKRDATTNPLEISTETIPTAEHQGWAGFKTHRPATTFRLTRKPPPEEPTSGPKGRQKRHRSGKDEHQRGTRTLAVDLLSDPISGTPSTTLSDIKPLGTHYQDISWPHQLMCGRSLQHEGGLGLFLVPGKDIPAGTRVGTYHGTTLRHHALAEQPRQDYLLEVAGMTIQAAEDCKAGYINDPFELGNCFLDIRQQPLQVDVLLRQPVLQGGPLELTLNYGPDYWTSARLNKLPANTAAKARQFYNLGKRTRRATTTATKRKPEKTPPKPKQAHARTTKALQPAPAIGPAPSIAPSRGKLTAFWQTAPTPTRARSISSTTAAARPQAPVGEAKVRVLLLGMVYCRDVPATLGGQRYRDGLRCQALEQLHPTWRVYTMDDKHASDGAYVVPGRHCHGSFTDFRRSEGALRQLEDGHLPFQRIMLDYYFAPSAWAETRWTQSLFSETIPRLAYYEHLASNGEIWLPHNQTTTTLIGTELTNAALHRYYHCELKTELTRQPLVQATAQVAEQMDQAKDRHVEAPPQSMYRLTRKEATVGTKKKRKREEEKEGNDKRPGLDPTDTAHHTDELHYAGRPPAGVG